VRDSSEAATIRGSVVRLLNSACVTLDENLYGPAGIRATLWLPRWWNCELAKVSEMLDRRWNTDFWSGEEAPAYPGAACEACGRRASMITYYEDSTGSPIELCGWCRPDPDLPITPATRRARLKEARDRSIRWSWKLDAP
jgi:hypothetical protein